MRLDVTPDMVEDIFSCLMSEEIADQQIALFFLDVLSEHGRINPTREPNLIGRVIELGREPTGRVRPDALKVLVRYYDSIPNFRPMMLEALKSDNPMVRKQSLLAYGRYCLSKEVAPLEGFEHDSYAAEMAMGGPLIYELRNLALGTIEQVIRKNFRKAERTEARSTGEVVFWWDWAPYHAWKGGIFKGFFR